MYRELEQPYIDDENALLQIVMKVLNSIPTNRTISRMESVMEIARLPLVICLELIVPVYANGYYKITNDTTRQDIISKYAH